MPYFILTPQHIADYERDGYLIVKNFLQKEETIKLSDITFGDASIGHHAIDLNDQTGKKTKLTSWYFPDNDAYGLLSKSKRNIRVGK